MHNFLKQYYFINKFNPDHLNNLSKNIGIIYRNYSENNNILIIKSISQFCKSSGRKFYISNNIKLAIKLDLDGVYFPSFERSLVHNCYNLKKNFKIIGSAHNLFEMNIKKKQNISEVFISPVFKKKGRNVLGIYGFIKLRNSSNIKSIVLGGVDNSNFNKLKNLKCYGFAAINFFDKKKGPS
tara:strand:+ start:270 stop:815 length:546 start_codon:yes stop_codon:yes gene_type:complete